MLKKIPKGEVTPLKGKQVYIFKDVIKTEKFPVKSPDVKITPDDIAYLQYTGGTTGAPKGAMLSHRNVVSDMIIVTTWMGWEQGKGLALSGFPFFHMAGLFFNATCIFVGLTQVLVPNPRDTDYICAQMEKYKPTLIVNVPSLYQLLMANPKFKASWIIPVLIYACAAPPLFRRNRRKSLKESWGKANCLKSME